MIWKFLRGLISLCFFMLNIIITLYVYIHYYRLIRPLRKNSLLKKKHSKCIIVHNGPSINKIDLAKIKNVDFMTMNRGFLHQNFSIIQPAYHIIVDPKFAKGIWPIDWLDKIHELSPNTKIVLNSKFLLNKNFRKIIKKYKRNKKLIWILPELYINFLSVRRKNSVSTLTYGAGAPGACCSLAHALQYSEVYFCGKDGDGLLREMLSMKSHFYGNNLENNFKKIDDYIVDLLMMSISLHNWRFYFKTMPKYGIEFYNMNKTGVFTFMKYKRYEK